MENNYQKPDNKNVFGLTFGMALGTMLTSMFQLPRYKSVPLDKDSIEVYFTYPKSLRPVCFVTCESVLLSLIKNAKKSIRVLAYSWTSTDIADAIAAAHRRGVDVRIILDKENEHRERQAVKIAAKNCKEVKIRSISGISHNKVIIIDEEIVCTGSYNFTKAANEKNDENLLIIRSPEIGRKYTECWNRIREYVHPMGAGAHESKRWDQKTMQNGRVIQFQDREILNKESNSNNFGQEKPKSNVNSRKLAEKQLTKKKVGNKGKKVDFQTYLQNKKNSNNKNNKKYHLAQKRIPVTARERARARQAAANVAGGLPGEM